MESHIILDNPAQTLEIWIPLWLPKVYLTELPNQMSCMDILQSAKFEKNVLKLK